MTLNIANIDEWKLMTISEVIVSKSIGRSIFPSLKFDAIGLDPFATYSASVILERVDDFKYKFLEGLWKKQSNSDTKRPKPQTITHKDGVKMGADWMAESIDFSFIKVSISTAKPNTFLLETMHLYQPKLVLTGAGEQHEFSDPLQQFISVSKATNRFRMLKEQLGKPSPERPIINRKRAAPMHLEAPQPKRIEYSDQNDSYAQCAQSFHGEQVRNVYHNRSPILYQSEVIQPEVYSNEFQENIAPVVQNVHHNQPLTFHQPPTFHQPVDIQPEFIQPEAHWNEYQENVAPVYLAANPQQYPVVYQPVHCENVQQQHQIPDSPLPSISDYFYV